MSPARGKKSSDPSTSPPVPLHAGHRERLRERFLRGGFGGMLDYEVMEVLLTLVIPRQDVKPLAKRLLTEFGTVSKVLDTPFERLLQIKGLGRASAVGLRILRASCDYCLEERCRESADILLTPERIRDFVRMKMGANIHETYMMIYLNSRRAMIDYRIIAEGTVDYVYAYPRNAAEIALNLHATGAVMIHNHPSGVCTPSAEDLTATNEMFFSLRALGVELLDHLIVSRDDCYSFRQHGVQLGNLQEGHRR